MSKVHNINLKKRIDSSRMAQKKRQLVLNQHKDRLLGKKVGTLDGLYITYFPYYTCNKCKSTSYGKAPYQQCSKCRAVHYCSRECQSDDWKEHKDKCAEGSDIDKFNTFIADISKNDTVNTHYRIWYKILRMSDNLLQGKLQYLANISSKHLNAKDPLMNVHLNVLESNNQVLIPTDPINIIIHFQLSDSVGNPVARRAIVIDTTLINTEQKAFKELIIKSRRLNSWYYIIWRHFLKYLWPTIFFTLVLLYLVCWYWTGFNYSNGKYFSKVA